MEKKSFGNLITEDQFWLVIEESLAPDRYSASSQFNILYNILLEKTEAELVGFWYHSTELYRKAYTSGLWAAAYIARGGCGDDPFHYFRAWLVRAYPETVFDAENGQIWILAKSFFFIQERGEGALLLNQEK